MKVFDYNEFSNHAPISINLQIGTERSSAANTINKIYYKWDDKYKNDFVHCLENDIQLLYSICEENVSIDVTVNKFSEFITDRANPFFQKCTTKRKENIFCSSNFYRKTKVV